VPLYATVLKVVGCVIGVVGSLLVYGGGAVQAEIQLTHSACKRLISNPCAYEVIDLLVSSLCFQM
jgi:ribosomal protein L25 (general stress protein Ctc)